MPNESRNDTTTNRPLKQARWWILTIPADDWTPQLPTNVAHIQGQLERGESGYEHYQIVATFAQKRTLSQCKAQFTQSTHCEPARSNAARTYCWKDDTRIGEPFEFGQLPHRRHVAADWDLVRKNAEKGNMAAIPSDIYVRYYGNLHKIRADNFQPTFRQVEVVCYWGLTGTGKSHKSWEEAGSTSYSKDPRTKFWCGYTDQTNVILDEFRGAIDISHLLRWFDKYPVRVETKGSSRPLLATKFWITSNLQPSEWYPDLDQATLKALLRRMKVVNLIKPFN